MVKKEVPMVGYAELLKLIGEEPASEFDRIVRSEDPWKPLTEENREAMRTWVEHTTTRARFSIGVGSEFELTISIYEPTGQRRGEYVRLRPRVWRDNDSSEMLDFGRL